MFRDDGSDSISSISENHKSNGSITTVSLSSQSSRASVVDRHAKNHGSLPVEEILEKSFNEVSNSISNSEEKAATDVVSQVINTSLQETTDLLELLTVEERHRRQQFERNIISVENSPRHFPSSRPKSAHPKSHNDRRSMVTFIQVNAKSSSRRGSSSSEKSGKKSSKQNLHSKNSKSRSRSPKGPARPKSRRKVEQSKVHLPAVGRSNERIEKLYNTQRYVENTQNYKLKPSSSRGQNYGGKNAGIRDYEDNEEVRRAVMSGSTRTSTSSQASNLYRPTLNSRPTTAGAKLITQNLKHPSKNKNFSFTDSRMREIQRENMRLYKNLVSISKPVVKAPRRPSQANSYSQSQDQSLGSRFDDSLNSAAVSGSRVSGGEGLDSTVEKVRDDVSEASTVVQEGLNGGKSSRARPKSARLQMGGGDGILAPSTLPTKKKLRNRPDSAASTHSKMSTKSNRSIKSNRSVKSTVSLRSNMSNTSLRSNASGFFYPTPAAKLNREREQTRIDKENYRIYERLKNVRPTMQTRY